MKELLKFVPPVYRDNRKLRYSILLILQINLGVFLYAIVFGAFFWTIDFQYGVVASCITMIAALFFLVLTRYCHSIVLNCCYFTFCSLALFTFMSLGTGGIHSPYIPWFLTVPAAIFFFLKRAYAIPWIIMTIACVLFIAASSIWEIMIVPPLPKIYLTWLQIINLSIITLVLGRMVQMFRRSYQRINKRAKRTNANLKEANEDLQNFAYIASHDLQTPLKGISSTITALKMHRKNKGAHFDPVENRCIDFVEDNAMRLAKLVEEILNYSRVGQHEEELSIVDLNEIVDSITYQTKAAGHYQTHLIKSEKLPTVVTDRAMIFQLFQNIIENGLKYNDQKYPSVLIDCLPDKDCAHLTFADNGIGIAPEDFDKIFGMFQRAGKTNNYKGTGIGLATCKRIMDQSGGKIWIESMPGNGAIFHVEIPKRKISENPQATKVAKIGNETSKKAV